MAVSRICSIPDCGKDAKRRTWCDTHYRRWLAHGDPIKVVKTPNGEKARFYRDVVLTYEGDECLIWPYATGNGYGYMRLNGRSISVTRSVCEEVHGAAPTPNHEAAHSCGNGHLACVAKRHLSWKTPKDNNADKIAHETHNRGERNGGAKLNEDNAREILALKGSLSRPVIAKMFGVSVTTILNIHSGKKWSWLTE